MTSSICLIGAGNMGGAMLRGWIGQGIAPARIAVVDPFAKDLPEGVAHFEALPVDERIDVLVLAVKPQQLGAIRDALAEAEHGPRLLISVLAGVEIDTLKAATRAGHVVRAMPNLPAAIGHGVTGLYSPTVDETVRGEAESLMHPLGAVEWIEREDLFHPLTALSGSGPGYVFRFIDALAEAGAELGLDREQALRLAIATVEGAAALAAKSAEGPGALADRVASPGGTTREGLNVLDESDAMKTLMARTLAAAARRSEEMAAQAR